jgi:hypothetical protein
MKMKGSELLQRYGQTVLQVYRQIGGHMDEEPFNGPIINWKRIKVYVWSDWVPFYDNHTTWNWIDIRWIHIGTEKAGYKSTFEVSLALLGFNVSIDWYYGIIGDLL